MISSSFILMTSIKEPGMPVFIIIIAMLFFISIPIYILIRNEWVYKIQSAWNVCVYRCGINLLDNENYDDYERYTYDELHAAIVSYNEMLYRQFWKWKVKYFIRDLEKFLFVMQNITDEISHG